MRNIASIVGISPEILNGVYGATKAYVVALTRSLQHELADKGIRFQAVLPGAIATDFWQAAGTHYEDLPASIVMSPYNGAHLRFVRYVTAPEKFAKLRAEHAKLRRDREGAFQTSTWCGTRCITQKG